MKITRIEPLFIDRFLYVQVETDKGITGLGESGTWGHMEASAAAINKFAEYLIGKDPRPIEHHWNVMLRAHHFSGTAITARYRRSTSRCGTSRANSTTSPSGNSSAAKCATPPACMDM